MRVLVTGGAGFIGSNLAGELVAQGNEVTVVDNLYTGKKENIHPATEFINGDIRDYGLLEKITSGVDAIFHLAAFVSVQESIKKPEDCYSINIGGTKNLIKAAGTNGVGRIVFSSSCAVYGGLSNRAVRETDKLHLSSPYAFSKYEGEKLLANSSKEYGFSYICLRYFNVFGERQTLDSAYAAVIPKFISSALSGKDVTIYGDGEQTRDFIYVKDIVNANILAMDDNVSNGVYNVGSGRSMSINELAELIIKSCNSSSRIKYEAERQGEIHFSLSEISKITIDLNWKQQYKFIDALKRTIKYYKAGSSGNEDQFFREEL